MADSPSHQDPPASGAEQSLQMPPETLENTSNDIEKESTEQFVHQSSSELQTLSKLPSESKDVSSQPSSTHHVDHNEPIPQDGIKSTANDGLALETESIDHAHLIPKLSQESHNLSTVAPAADLTSDDNQSSASTHHTLWTKPETNELPQHPITFDRSSASESHSPQLAPSHHTKSPSLHPSRQPAISETGHEQSDTPLTTRSETPRRHMEEPRGKEFDAVSTASDSIAFTPKSSPLRPHFPSSEFHSSPDVTEAHRIKPKETHLAEVEFDPVSGRKIINEYEVLTELGRGQHGKVKLCRSLETSQLVAIKIIERVSKRRRLGRSSNQESKIKREIAILKKARHTNIVSLLEIIDDPTLRKVYIVLEHVENGEIKWRIKGEQEICLVNYRRYMRELSGTLEDPRELKEDERIIKEATDERKLQREEESRRIAELHFRLGPWSLEHGGDSDMESNNEFPLGNDHEDNAAEQGSISLLKKPHKYSGFLAASSSATQNRHSATYQTDEYKTALEGNEFGSYNALTAGEDMINQYTNFSDIGDTDDDSLPENFTWVPRLTLEEARRAMRDTVLGLEFLHYQGIIHRDIKPANLLLTRDYRIKISDFGVSYLGKAVNDEFGEEHSESEAQDLDEAIELAKTVGTPAFYAPELCVTDFDEQNPPLVTNQIDVWALGVTLFCLVFGRTPFYDANTFVLMRQIAETPVHIPRHRLRAVEVDNNGRVLFDPSLQVAQSPNPEHRRRLGDQLIYEDVDDDLCDLLKGLLEKDPVKRLKLSQVKKHKWLLAGMHDPTGWMKESDPSLMTKGKKIEVSKEDVEHAVRLNFVDNIKNVTKRLVGTFGGLVKSNTRKRAISSAAAPGSQPPSTNSSSSNMSQEALRLETRRASLRPDELVSSALRASRESDHPLSQSVTASPDIKDGRQFFLPASGPESPSIGPNPTSTPWSSRPDTLEREASTTGSIRTIRPADLNHPEGYIPLTAPWSHFYSEHMAGPGGLFGGNLKRPSLYDFDAAHSHPEITSPVDENMRAEPTLGISNMTASGLLNRPAGLLDHATASSAAPSPLSFKPESIASYSEFVRIRGSDTMSRVSSNHSVSSIASRSRPKTETYSENAKGSFLPLSDTKSIDGKHDSEDEKLRRAKDEQIRRLIKEGQDHLEATHEMPHDPNMEIACPPSPDDFAFMNRSGNATLTHPASAIELDSTSNRQTVIQTSHSEDHFASEMSQSTSNRSLPSALSAFSSVGMEMGGSQYGEDDPKYHGMDTPVAHHETFETVDYTVDDPSETHDLQQVEDDSGDESDGSFVEMSFAKKPRRSTTEPPAATSSSHAS